MLEAVLARGVHGKLSQSFLIYSAAASKLEGWYETSVKITSARWRLRRFISRDVSWQLHSGGTLTASLRLRRWCTVLMSTVKTLRGWESVGNPPWSLTEILWIYAVQSYSGGASSYWGRWRMSEYSLHPCFLKSHAVTGLRYHRVLPLFSILSQSQVKPKEQLPTLTMMLFSPHTNLKMYVLQKRKYWA